MPQEVSKKFLSLIKKRHIPDLSPDIFNNQDFIYEINNKELQTYSNMEPCVYHTINSKFYKNIDPISTSSTTLIHNISHSLPKPIQTSLIANPFQVKPHHKYRPIIIDGQNVAFHISGRQRPFSWRHLEIIFDFFLHRGHTDIQAVLPKRCEGTASRSIHDFKILKRLRDAGALIWSPTRQSIDGRDMNPYDDKYIIRVAILKNAIIVSNDQFRDLMRIRCDWKRYIAHNLLMFSFVDHQVLFPDDPLGKDGPTLDEFLVKETTEESIWQIMKDQK